MMVSCWYLKKRIKKKIIAQPYQWAQTVINRYQLFPHSLLQVIIQVSKFSLGPGPQSYKPPYEPSVLYLPSNCVQLVTSRRSKIESFMKRNLQSREQLFKDLPNISNHLDVFVTNNQQKNPKIQRRILKATSHHIFVFYIPCMMCRL